MAADRYELLDMSKEQSLLEQIIQQAQHFFMRRRSEYVLDTIAKEVCNPTNRTEHSRNIVQSNSF